MTPDTPMRRNADGKWERCEEPQAEAHADSQEITELMPVHYPRTDILDGGVKGPACVRVPDNATYYERFMYSTKFEKVTCETCKRMILNGQHPVGMPDAKMEYVDQAGHPLSTDNGQMMRFTGMDMGIGQQWCKPCDGDWLVEDKIIVRMLDGPTSCMQCLILCNVFQNSMTGKITYVPVQLKDIPVINQQGEAVKP